jgi:Polysaccharide deacetylase
MSLNNYLSQEFTFNSRAKCRLPDCLCADTDPPLGLKAEEIPQLVFLTFDDHVNESEFKLYQQIFLQRYNPNGCPIGLTFYVSHHHERDATNYELVNQLYRMGHEIASHTVT